MPAGRQQPGAQAPPPPALTLQLAYVDCPHPIGYGATISAPHMHAHCLEMLAAKLQPGATVRASGRGCGRGFRGCRQQRAHASLSSCIQHGLREAAQVEAAPAAAAPTSTADQRRIPGHKICAPCPPTLPCQVLDVGSGSGYLTAVFAHMVTRGGAPGRWAGAGVAALGCAAGRLCRAAFPSLAPPGQSQVLAYKKGADYCPLIVLPPQGHWGGTHPRVGGEIGPQRAALPARCAAVQERWAAGPACPTLSGLRARNAR